MPVFGYSPAKGIIGFALQLDGRVLFHRRISEGEEDNGFWKPTFSLLPVNLLFPCGQSRSGERWWFSDARPTERSLAFKTEGS